MPALPSELILRDLKHVLRHAKEKGDTEIADKLQLNCDELEAKVKSEGAETENNSDTGLELDEMSVKFKNEGNEATLFSRWVKLDQSDFLPQSGPLSVYNDLIMETYKVKHKTPIQVLRNLAHINSLKLKRSCGYELTEQQVERVLSEEDSTDEIMKMISKKYIGFKYVWMKFPRHIPKKHNANEIPTYYQYKRNNGALIKKSRRSKLNKQLREIQSLKKNHSSGGVGLNTAQLAKIKREEELLEELADQHSGLYVI